MELSTKNFDQIPSPQMSRLYLRDLHAYVTWERGYVYLCDLDMRLCLHNLGTRLYLRDLGMRLCLRNLGTRLYLYATWERGYAYMQPGNEAMPMQPGNNYAYTTWERGYAYTTWE